MIPKIEDREFGFMLSDGKWRRYMTFESDSQLYECINASSFAGCFVSVAYFTDPAHRKGWYGADLFFDLDCKDNIKLARADAEIVYNSLINDFGLNALAMNFSGLKGYHIISFDPRVLKLKSDERAQIVEYLTVRRHVETLDVPACCDITRLRRIENTTHAKSGKKCIRMCEYGGTNKT